MINPTVDIDYEAFEKLSKHIDPNVILRTLATMDAPTLQKTLMAAAGGGNKKKQAPAINSDFFDIYDSATPEQRRIGHFTREFMEREIKPYVAEYWEKGETPKEWIPKAGELIKGLFGENYVFEYPSSDPVAVGLMTMEMAAVEPSFQTFFGVQWALCMASIQMFGSEEQKAKWIPDMVQFKKIGSWALTEPDVGSATAAGLETTAEKHGDTWIINGQKKWSGNATIADVNVIWAKNSETGQVNAFLVETGQPGYTVEKLEGKISKRMVENVLITLNEVEVHESNRLPGVTSFKDAAAQLATARAGVGWEAVGQAKGAYEATLAYANKRMQFGKPITKFQLVQMNLVKMLGNLTAMQTMAMRMAQLEERDGHISHERASLSKAWMSEKLRETVAIGRGTLGGNGILIEHDIARFFVDAEANYSYEGTYEMNSLIVGRAITGQSAFV